MKLDHLIFGQLRKLQHATTLMRVTRTYHTALRRAWDENAGFGSIEFYTVTLAESYLPEIKKRYAPVLAFLIGQELKDAVRRAADAQPVTPTPAAPLTLVTLSHRMWYDGNAQEALAEIITEWCSQNSVPAHFKWNAEGDIEIRAETGPLGVALLHFKSGLTWRELESECSARGLQTHDVFWWLLDLRPAPFARVNPLVWPVNTPDIYETAKCLIHEPA
jgi:hypothetical protein